MTPILILAAGASRRMGGVDKLLKPINGVPLLVRTVRRAVATGHQVFVAIPGPWHPRYAALRQEQATCFDVPDATEGVGGTLRGSVSRLPPCDAFMIMLADLPDIETTDMLAVLNGWRQSSKTLISRGATENGAPGHPIVFSSSLRPQFAELAGDKGANVIILDHVQTTQLVPLAGLRARLDLDTPEDWNQFEKANESV